MKTKKKGGFTLVELLVVIAILAILSTVSIVGYTSFMQRAAVSNDENVASQINNFLTALRVDSSSEYYGEEITVHNMRDIRDTIMREGGLSSLAPQAEKYGYHFYYDLEEEKVVLKQDDDVRESLSRSIFALFASAAEEEYEITPANCFTLGGRYVLLDDENSALGAAVDAFYKVESQADIEAISSLIDDCGVFAEKIRAYLGSVVIITNSGNYALGSAPYVRIAFAQGVTTINKSVETLIAESVTKLSIPSSVKFIEGGALNAVNTDLVIEFNRTPEEIGKMAFEGFTNANIRTTNGIYNCTTGAEDGAFAGQPVIRKGDDVSTEVLLGFDNPANDIKLEISKVDKKAEKGADNAWAYVAYDLGTFTIIPDIIGEDPSLPSSVTASQITWEVIAGGDHLQSNGDGTFTYTSKPETDEIIKIKATINGTDLTAEYEIKTVLPVNYTLILDKKTVSGDSTHTINYNPDQNVSVSLNVEWAEGVSKYNYPEAVTDKGIELDLTQTIEIGDNSSLIYNNGKLGVKSGTRGVFNEVITIKLGDYASFTKNVTFYDVTADVLERVNNNIMYVGNGGAAVKLSDFFKIKDDTDIPAGAKLVFCKTSTDANTYNISEIAKYPTNTSEEGVYVDNNYIEVTNANFNDISFNFKGTADNPAAAWFCLAVDNIRISDWVKIDIKKANNVRTYTDFDTGNYVFLNDIILNHPNGETSINGEVYGNGFEYNVVNACDVFANIVLKGKLYDLKIIGKVYKDFSISMGKSTSASVIVAQGKNAYIENCYIANGRSPVCVYDSATLTIKDSLVFGGRMSNIAIYGGGTLNIEGDVTTIQREVDDGNGNKILGMGILCWFDDKVKTVNIDQNANFKQYNFLSENETKNLPDVGFKVGDYMEKPSWLFDRLWNKVKDMSVTVAEFDKIFKDTLIATKNEASYGNYWFKNNGLTYVNSGIVCLDKYVDKNHNQNALNFNGYANYSSAEYTMSIIGFIAINVIAGGIFDDKGIHKNTMVCDIWTPHYKKADVVSQTNIDMFNEYLALGDTLDPENVQFNSSASGCMWQAKAGNAQ